MKDFTLNQAFANVRKLIGKSQAQFGALIGASRDAVISVENKRCGVSKEMAERVRVATGAELRPKGNLVCDWPERAYLADDYERHCKRFSEENASDLFLDASEWLQVIYRAASLPGFAGLKNRLPALHESFVQWMEKTATEFELEAQIDSVLEQDSKASTKFVKRWYLDGNSENSTAENVVELKSTLRTYWNPRGIPPSSDAQKRHREAARKHFQGSSKIWSQIVNYGKSSGKPPSPPSASGARRRGARKPSR